MTSDVLARDDDASPFRPPAFFEFNGDSVEAGLTRGQQSWFFRAQNLVVGVSWLSEGETIETTGIPDEHALVIQEGTSLEVASNGQERIPVEGPAFVVVPAGASTLVGKEAGFFLRVFSAHATEMLAEARNNAMYAASRPDVAVLTPLAGSRAPSGLRVHQMSEVPHDPDRLGRIFRTESLMINWFEPQIGPRDTTKLTPHSHDDFEQVSVSLTGEFVHHVRRPWTARMADWRPDEHVQVLSPSVTVIPPGNIHTTRAVGDGLHQLVDVFAPPREDFIEQGWVLNQADYD